MRGYDPATGGIFSETSMVWKVSCERAILLGGPTAAILQIAHPAVGHGVARHSNFQYDGLGRLERTLASVYAISFGTAEEVEKSARVVRKMHERVKADAAATHPAYNAMDPDLQLWVVATLVMGAVTNYELLIGPLTEAEKEGYLRDVRVWGEFFGLDPSHGPQTWPAFLHYYKDMIAGPLLGSDPVSAMLTHQILHPSRPLAYRWIIPRLEYLATETIPSPLRERLGLRSTPGRRLAWKLTCSLLPAIYRWSPSILRYPREYLQARSRLRKFHKSAPAGSLESRV